MSSNLSIRFIHPDANGRGREPLEELLVRRAIRVRPSPVLGYVFALRCNATLNIQKHGRDRRA
jgi:hypothetical protein